MNGKTITGITLIIVLLASAMAGCVPKPEPTPVPADEPAEKTQEPSPMRVDDWAMTQTTVGATQITSVSKVVVKEVPVERVGGVSPKAGSGSIGLSTGGAKDVQNFRQNIKNRYLPLPTDVTYEGLFYDYYFDTGEEEACQKLFCPSYAYAVTRDPFSGEVEYYLSVGLNSGLKQSDFQRKKLNLVIVLDVSGSMSSPFNRYYYDQFGNRVEHEGSPEELSRSKIAVATESVVALLDHLKDDDRFGMVLFSNDAVLAKPLNLVGATDMAAIRGHVLEMAAGGSTNMSAGMAMATELLADLEGVDPAEYENRIIFLTDAMPNQGETGERGLLGMTEGNAGSRIHTTFIGIGVDFNTELVEYITKIRGANYYSVHSARQFKERMDEQFEFMVTPLVFDLVLTLDAKGWEIAAVYGSPEADQATGELMRVNTLFPSAKREGETRGGLVLLKLRKISDESRLVLKVSYQDRSGKPDTSEAVVDPGEWLPEYFGNSGIRKGVLLARYADLLKNWIIDEREHANVSRPWEARVDSERGIVVPPPDLALGRWERQSLPLTVSESYRDLFRQFLGYFRTEMKAIDDATMSQETEILSALSD